MIGKIRAVSHVGSVPFSLQRLCRLPEHIHQVCSLSVRFACCFYPLCPDAQIQSQTKCLVACPTWFTLAFIPIWGLVSPTWAKLEGRADNKTATLLLPACHWCVHQCPRTAALKDADFLKKSDHTKQNKFEATFRLARWGINKDKPVLNIVEDLLAVYTEGNLSLFIYLCY